jgi:hypothetical protein
MMHSFAAIPDKLGNEAVVAGQLLDKLHSDPPDVQVLPQEAAAGLFAYLLFMTRVGRKVTLEKSHTAINRVYRNRDVVKANSHSFNQSHSAERSPFCGFEAGTGHSLRASIISPHASGQTHNAEAAEGSCGGLATIHWRFFRTTLVASGL